MLTGVLIAGAPLEAQVLGGGGAVRGTLGGSGAVGGAGTVGGAGVVAAAGSGTASANDEAKSRLVDKTADGTAKARDAAGDAKGHAESDAKKTVSQTSTTAKSDASRTKHAVSTGEEVARAQGKNDVAAKSTSAAVWNGSTRRAGFNWGGSVSGNASRNGVNASDSQQQRAALSKGIRTPTPGKQLCQCVRFHAGSIGAKRHHWRRSSMPSAAPLM